MSGSLYLADTNVLLRLIKVDDPKYLLIRAAISALERKNIRLAYTFQNMTEFWNTCTRPIERNGFGLSADEVENNAREIEVGFIFLGDNRKVYREWRRLVFKYKISGVQVHDARLAAAMYTHGLTHILTLNGADFRRFPGITAVHPGSV